MFNILLDDLPTEYEGYIMNTDFSVGIMLTQAQKDPDISPLEKIQVIKHLLFFDETKPDKELPDAQTAMEAARFFLNGWYTDNYVEPSQKDPVTDYDTDQWRIYAAFLHQYHIDLNTVEYMHFWTFMGLLTNLEECAFNRIAAFREEKLPAKNNMTNEQKKRWKEQKERYRLNKPETTMSEEEIAAQERCMELIKPKKREEGRRQELIKKLQREQAVIDNFMQRTGVKRRGAE